MKRNDTIAAIATPPGVGGLAVVRLSGPEALPIALRHLDVERLEPRHATYCRFDQLDDLVALYMPRGYSGEPTVEFSCHGSRYVQETLLQTLLADGARLADPGEFTLRAFLGGRLDLSQAEAVADLIDAVTPAQHHLAVSQLRGGYARKLADLRRQLVDLASLLELELDFSQEDVEFADRTKLRQLLSILNAQLSTLISSFAMGNALKQGLPVAIVGSPNVGKSTLLNALLDDDRAIVSPVPGTTRDTVEGMLTLGGITFRLVDTAGLRATDDVVERLGIERSHQAVDQALIVIHVLDATHADDLTTPATTDDGKQHLWVLNKCDLRPDLPAPADGLLPLSGLTRQGIDRLEQALLDACRMQPMDDSQSPLLTNLRHRDALLRVQEALRAVDDGLGSGLPTDLVAVDLRDALYHLGTVTGDVASDEVLHNIFSRFCIGK